MGPRGPMALVIFVPSVPGVLSHGAYFSIIKLSIGISPSVCFCNARMLT
jgi:hypothetical protein